VHETDVWWRAADMERRTVTPDALPLPELLDHRRPEAPDLGVGLKPRLHPDHLRDGIDDHALSEGANHGELTPLTGEQPQQIPVAEGKGCGAMALPGSR